tara:strand:- start:19952 stop:20122 length:171 start_codon:yes stop_codon:yes gene_type:complete
MKSRQAIKLETIAKLQSDIETKIVDVMTANEDSQEDIDYMLEEIHVTIDLFKIRNI